MFIINHNNKIYIEYTFAINAFLIVFSINLFIIFSLTLSLRSEFERSNTIYRKYMNLKHKLQHI